MLSMRPYQSTDAYTIEIRDIDKIECEVIHGTLKWRDILFSSVMNSDLRYSFTLGEKLVGIGGVVFRESGEAEVWLVGTEELTKYPIRLHKTLMDIERHYIPERYTLLTCSIWSENNTHLSWLTNLGYRVYTQDPYKGILYLAKERTYV